MPGIVHPRALLHEHNFVGVEWARADPRTEACFGGERFS